MGMADLAMAKEDAGRSSLVKAEEHDGLVKEEDAEDEEPAKMGEAKAESASSAKVSPAETPMSGSASPGTPSGARAATRKKAAATYRTPPLFDHEPSALAEALKTFDPLNACVYQNKHMGDAAQGEIMTCECKPELVDGVNMACGPGSDCINRITTIECLQGNCDCGDGCQNQRFQRQQYAAVDVIATEHKGFGLRAMSDLEKDCFVYEYVGEVIDEPRFRSRLELYDKSGIKHFYFMMLQRGEYIDATKRGCLARFCNHSCNPNCYVDKWVVGTKLKMGIFAKRAIQRGEELTFDYNVDRYGANPQTCYCGEPNCVGVIGGKTQTDESIKLPESVYEALGIPELEASRDVSFRELKKMARKNDDYSSVFHGLPALPVSEEGVTRIMGVLLQNKERWVTRKIIQRLANSDGAAVQRRIMKLHGYQILGSVLTEWKEDDEITTMILEILQKWPRITRNKISSAKIEPAVKELAESENEYIQTMSKALLEEWGKLEMAYRIPRGAKARVEYIVMESSESPSSVVPPPPPPTAANETRESSADRGGVSKPAWRPKPSGSARPPRPRLPDGWEYGFDQYQRPYYVYTLSGFAQYEIPTEKDTELAEARMAAAPPRSASANFDLAKIIEDANRKVKEKEEQERLAQEEKRRLARASKEAKERREREREEKRRRHKHRRRREQHTEGEQKPKRASMSEHELKKVYNEFKMNLVRFVPNVTAKYQERLGKEEFRKRAKQIVGILVDKEKARGKRTSAELSDGTKAKIKKWAVVYMDKVYRNRQEKQAKKARAPAPTQGGDEKEEEEDDDDAIQMSESESESESDDSDSDGDDCQEKNDTPVAHATSDSATSTPATEDDGRNAERIKRLGNFVQGLVPDAKRMKHT